MFFKIFHFAVSETALPSVNEKQNYKFHSVPFAHTAQIAVSALFGEQRNTGGKGYGQGKTTQDTCQRLLWEDLFSMLSRVLTYFGQHRGHQAHQNLSMSIQVVFEMLFLDFNHHN